jgi:hypothetical protein
MTTKSSTTAITTPELSAYKLTKPLLEKFKRFDQLCDYLQRARKDPPECVRLYHHDYVALDARVREESNGAHSAASVSWRGYPIRSDRVPQRQEAA